MRTRITLPSDWVRLVAVDAPTSAGQYLIRGSFDKETIGRAIAPLSLKGVEASSNTRHRVPGYCEILQRDFKNQERTVVYVGSIDRNSQEAQSLIDTCSQMKVTLELADLHPR